MNLNELIEEVLKNVTLDDIREHAGEKGNAFIDKIEDLIGFADAVSEEGVDAKIIALRGATMFFDALADKLASGKILQEFEESDWKEIWNKAKDETISTRAKDYTSMVFCQYYNYLSQVWGLVSEGVSDDAHAEVGPLLIQLDDLNNSFIDGNIEEVMYIEDAEILCLEIMVKIMGSKIEGIFPDYLKPIVLPVVGYAVEFGRNKLYSNQLDILRMLENERTVFENQLDEEYKQFELEFKANVAETLNLINHAFDSNVKAALKSSAALARKLGVPEEEILDNVEKVDDYFLN